MNTVLIAVPLVVFALVAAFGFVGCTNTYERFRVRDGTDPDGAPDGGPPDGEPPDGEPPDGEPTKPEAYADKVNISGLIAWWRLGEAIGSTTAVDMIGASPGNHPGTYVGSVQLEEPGLNLSEPLTTAALFDGNSFVQVVPQDAAFQTSAFTITALVHPDSVVAAGVVVGYMSSSGGWQLRIHPVGPSGPANEGQWQAEVNGGSGIVGLPPVPVDLATLGTASHLAMTYDGNTLTLFRDGVPEAAGPLQYTPNTQEPLRIGPGFTGAIQDIALYDRELAPAEINEQFLANKPPDEP